MTAPLQHYAGDDLIVSASVSDPSGSADLAGFDVEALLVIDGRTVSTAHVTVDGGEVRAVFPRHETARLAGTEPEMRLSVIDGHAYRKTLVSQIVCVAR